MRISLSEFERTISADRIGPYLRRTKDPHDAICLYLWNLELSQELYAVLSSLEIALRNTIHAAGTNHFSRDDWFREPSCVTLLHEQERMILAAKYKCWEDKLGKQVAKQQKKTLPWPNVGDHIAGLMFGFWAGLMNAPYEALLWDPTGVSPNLISAAFPHANRANRQRQVIAPKIEALRKLRNRISHGEPILWWHPPIDAHHQSALDVLSWISPAQANLLTLVDHFQAARARGQSYYSGLFTLDP